MTVVLKPVVRYFDNRVAAIRKIEAKERRVLFQTAGYGRTTMRRIIPRRKKQSQPGNPPHAHKPGGQALKDVRFAVNLKRAEVVIGHVKYPRQSRRDSQGRRRTIRSGKPVPQLLNEGGSATLEISGDEKRAKQSVPLNYQYRPFREKSLDIAERFFRERIRRERL